MFGYNNYFTAAGFSDLFFRKMFADMDRFEKERIKKSAGITCVNGFEGIEKLDIPFIYDYIEVNHENLFCYKDGINYVYDYSGKFLFDCEKIKNYKQGYFLAGETMSDEGIAYALFHEGTQLTEYIFEPYSDNEFNKCGYTLVLLYKEYTKAVIDKLGNIIFTTDRFEHPYLYGCILSTKNKYLNLLTGEIICNQNYSDINTDDFIFVKVESNCVYQITKTTGNFIIHGVAPKPKEEPIKIIPVEPKPKEPKIRRQERNEPCNCGSGKKFKYCCLK